MAEAPKEFIFFPCFSESDGINLFANFPLKWTRLQTRVGSVSVVQSSSEEGS